MNLVCTRHALQLNSVDIHGEDKRLSSWVTTPDYWKRYAHPETKTSEEGLQEEPGGVEDTLSSQEEAGHKDTLTIEAEGFEEYTLTN